jgi:hypothetical protein
MQIEKPKRKSRGTDYVNNAIFSEEVMTYVNSVTTAKEAGTEPPNIPNDIGEAFMKICNGLARSPSFMNYSYREDMVMDAVENCVKAIMNYDVTKTTRTGAPNAFSYFTQIAYFAFLRRIAKEKKQTTIKQLLIEKGGIGMFAQFDDDALNGGETMVEKIRQKNDAFYNVERCTSNGEALPQKKTAPKRVASVKKSSGPLTDFLNA